MITFKVFLELLGCEGCGAVAHVGSWNHSMFKAHCFKFLDDFKGFMGVQVLLAFSSHKSTGGVHNDATSSESRSISSASTGEGDSLGCADKMVHKNGLAWEQFVLLEHWGLVGDSSGAWLGLGTTTLTCTRMSKLKNHCHTLQGDQL